MPGPCFLRAGAVCLINCVIGLIFTMEAGNYWFDIFNDYAATLSLLLIVLVETIAVCYIYGIRRYPLSPPAEQDYWGSDHWPRIIPPLLAARQRG